MGPGYEELIGWGGRNRSSSYVYRPRTLEDVETCVTDALGRGFTLGHRGAGQSYGDVALNRGNAILDFSRLDEVVDFDPELGTVRVLPGCTIEKLIRHVLPWGWWPPVVPGTMKVSVGGATAANVHGKNHYASGTFGDHVAGLSLLTPEGIVELKADADLSRLRAVVGSLGLTGTILDVTIRLRRVSSGVVRVRTIRTQTLAETLNVLYHGALYHEHAVAWLDCMVAEGAGRGILHLADETVDGDDLAGLGFDEGAQKLPHRLFNVLPRSFARHMLRPALFDPAVRVVGALKWKTAPREAPEYVQSFTAFHFLLDYIPGWQKAYGRRGLVQYQLFVPREEALDLFSEAMRLQRKHGVYSYLAVAKCHRKDEFAGRYSPDGFSLALDFPGGATQSRLPALIRDLEALRETVGGRLYGAKDSLCRGRLPDYTLPAYANDLARRWGLAAA